MILIPLMQGFPALFSRFDGNQPSVVHAFASTDRLGYAVRGTAGPLALPQHEALLNPISLNFSRYSFALPFIIMA